MNALARTHRLGEVCLQVDRLSARWVFPLLIVSVIAGVGFAGSLAPGAALSPYLLGLLTLSVSSSLDWNAFRSSQVSAWRWARLFLTGYLVYAGGALLLGLAFPLPDPGRVGLLLLALAPPANTASMWTREARGDVGVALSGITLGNGIAPVLLALPLALAGVGAGAGEGLLLAWRMLVPFVLAPALLGMALGGRDPFRGPAFQQASRLLARASVMSIMLFNAAALWHQSRPPFSLLLPLAAGVVAIEGAVYALSLLRARSHPVPAGRRAAFAFLQATRNTALVIALASSALGPQAALPAMVAFVVQEPLAALVARGLARTEERHPGIGSSGPRG